MMASAPTSNLGRQVFGVSTFALGLITLVWHDYNGWHQPLYLVYAAAVALILGGVAILFSATAKPGAVLVAAVYLVFTAQCMPGIIAASKTYNSWGNFFEQLSLVTGAALVFARFSSWSPETRSLFGRLLFGISTVSFTLEQAFYLGPTANFVPKWFPPSPMFWAIATTVLFALAALALLTNVMALLASRLLTAMLVLFGLIIWIPLLLKDPHSHTNWSETALTFVIAGVSWLLADLLAESRPVTAS